MTRQISDLRFLADDAAAALIASEAGAGGGADLTLSNLSNAGTARTNLGLGTSATHATGDFLLTTNNLSDVTAATARTNLGLGTVATHAATEFLLTTNNLSDVTAATARTNLGLGTAAVNNTGDFLLAANNLSDVTAATARTNLSVQPTASPTFTGTVGAATITATAQVQGQSLRASGNTGAASPIRLVGANATGAPASGTWAQGDIANDQAGVVYQCITAGTPGTWVTLVPNPSMLPDDLGLMAWTLDPVLTAASMTATAATIYFGRMRLAKRQLITGVAFSQTTSGITITNGGVALYASDGQTLLASSNANPAAYTAAVGYQQAPFQATVTRDPGVYLAAMWVGTAGTPPAWNRGSATATANLGLTAGASRFGTAQTTQNSTTAPATLTSMTAMSNALFIALY